MIRIVIRFTSAAAALLTIVAATPARAADEQFLLIGTLEKFTLNSGAANPAADRTVGGLMRVAGHDVILPRNLQIRFPTQFLTPAETFEGAPAGSTRSGLALDDLPPVPFEVEVIGNIVGGRYIAGMVAIAQVSLATGGGYIKAIAADGRMTIGPLLGPATAADAIVQLNDPKGRFGPKTDTRGFDERFQVDADNPSVTAETGFPMCVQATGSPAYCKSVNRSVPGRLFVMGSVDLPPSPAGGLTVPHCSACQPTSMAPLRVGDAVVYSGILHRVGPGQRMITAYSLTANVGIYTSPGVDPAYLRIEGSLEGTAGPAIPRNPAQPNGPKLPDEVQDRFKVEGFTTDPTRPMIIYAIDVNPTTKVQTLRRLFTLESKEPPRGRFFKVVGKNSGVLTARNHSLRGNTREIMLRLGGSVVPDDAPLSGLPDVAIMKRIPSDTGVIANRYVAPIDEYIFPENKLPGDPLVPNNFECVSFLLSGSGPLATGEPLGRLNPWPSSIATPVLDCGTRAGPLL